MSTTNIFKKQALLLVLILVTALGAGCNQAGPATTGEQTGQARQESEDDGQAVGTAGPCTPGNVAIEGYGDPGKRLGNCFVQYPGEPSRQDKNYYIVEDVCGQFTQEFISHLTGREIFAAEPSPLATVHGCSYYFDSAKKNYVMLVLDYLNVDKQKKNREFIGHTIKTESRIPMENFLSYQKDGQLNSTYLVLNPNKYLRLERSNGTAVSEADMLDLASKLGAEIKDYK